MKTGIRYRLLAVSVSIAITSLPITPVLHAEDEQQATAKHEQEIKKQFSYTFKDVRDKLVELECTSRVGNITGRGFIAKSDDSKTYIYTTQHLIMGTDAVSFKTVTGEELHPKAVELSAERDLARLLIDDRPALALSDNPAMGIPLAVFGNTEDDGETEHYGQVIGIGTNHFEISAEFAAGNSGSPVLNLNKEVMGVASYLRFTPLDKLDVTSLDKLKENTSFENKARHSYCSVTEVRWLPVDWRRYNQTVGKAYRENEGLIVSIFNALSDWLRNPLDAAPNTYSNGDVQRWANELNRRVDHVNSLVVRLAEKGHATPKELDRVKKQMGTQMGKSAKELLALCNRQSKQIKMILSKYKLTGFLREEFEGYAASLRCASEAIREVDNTISDHEQYKFKFLN